MMMRSSAPIPMYMGPPFQSGHLFHRPWRRPAYRVDHDGRPGRLRLAALYARSEPVSVAIPQRSAGADDGDTPRPAVGPRQERPAQGRRHRRGEPDRGDGAGTLRVVMPQLGRRGCWLALLSRMTELATGAVASGCPAESAVGRARAVGPAEPLSAGLRDERASSDLALCSCFWTDAGVPAAPRTGPLRTTSEREPTPAADEARSVRGGSAPTAQSRSQRVPASLWSRARASLSRRADVRSPCSGHPPSAATRWRGWCSSAMPSQPESTCSASNLSSCPAGRH